VNVLDKQLRTADRGLSYSFRGLTTHLVIIETQLL
jgi:hypothetical protein